MVYVNCIYEGKTPVDNLMCVNCELFLETCTPVVSYDGYSNGECDCYLCEFCQHQCNFKSCVNL